MEYNNFINYSQFSSFVTACKEFNKPCIYHLPMTFCMCFFACYTKNAIDASTVAFFEVGCPSKRGKIEIDLLGINYEVYNTEHLYALM